MPMIQKNFQVWEVMIMNQAKQIQEVNPIATTEEPYVVICRFKNNPKDYDFLYDRPVQTGDVVVVDTIHGLQVASVVGVKESSSISQDEIRWVVDVVDISSHRARLERKRRMKELKREMRSRAKKLDELAKYQLLAQTDPTMASLLQEFLELERGNAPQIKVLEEGEVTEDE